MNMPRLSLAQTLALALTLLALSADRPEAQCAIPAFCGQWEGPFDLDVSCPVVMPCRVDEIVHAALIPSGVHKGDVVFWTRCHGTDRGSCTIPYRSHVLDPQTMSAVAHPTFASAYGPGVPDGPFCSGHTWMLDQDENPKLLVAGGVRIGTGFSSSETFWFDPNSTVIQPGSNPPETQYWFDGPGALPSLDGQLGGVWYPSVLTFLDHARTPPRFRPMVVGGTEKPGFNCADTYSGWWTMDLPPAGSTAAPQWNTVANPDGYKWPTYPRTRFLHTDSGQGEVVTAGKDSACPMDPPCQKIVTGTPVQTHAQFAQPVGVGAWQENNAVLQHPLRPSWVWNTTTPLAEYQLNRLIGLMGVENEMSLGLVETRELIYGSVLETGPSTPQWREKADAPVGRVFSNSVLLPDGSVLVVGGQNNVRAGGDASTLYRFAADRFEPQNPLEAGAWSTLAETTAPDPVNGKRTPRGYHSVAMLLSDGSVVLMGGQNDADASRDYPVSDDTAEIFKPPYFFNGSRPVLGTPGETIRYGQTFLVNLTVSLGRQVDRFCLMGVGSVTHAHDAGQRYIELMWRNPPPSGGPPQQANKQREVLAPPAADMAPEGYYMLFGVDDAGVPSLGRFVKLTF